MVVKGEGVIRRGNNNSDNIIIVVTLIRLSI